MAALGRYARDGGRKNLKRISKWTFNRWLKELGLSQTRCAAIMNVDPRSVRAWALGQRAVPGPAITVLEMLFQQEARAGRSFGHPFDHLPTELLFR